MVDLFINIIKVEDVADLGSFLIEYKLFEYS